jgi:Fe-S cluster assembly protein SufD
MISKHDSNAVPLVRDLDRIAKSLHGEPTARWFQDLRGKGLSRFTELGIPTVKDEEWKYTSLTALAGQTFAVAAESRLVELDALQKYCGPGEVNIVFVDGIFSEELSNVDKRPEGITVSPLEEAVINGGGRLEQLLTRYDIDHETAFVALNEALSGRGTYIHIPAKTVYKELVHIVHVAGSGQPNTVAMPRTVITLGKSSEATVLESHIAFNDTTTYFSNALTDIFIDEDATLRYCKAQKESLKAFHIGHTRVWQERGSNFDGFSFMAGAAITRNDLDVVLNGEGANAALNALYSVYDGQHVDNHTSVDHRVPHCNSNQLYKGVLNNAARAVFNGKIFVRPIAQQTNSYQLNKNLLLGKNCRIDTKPQLEIFADDVKCTHGATIGQLDEDHLFYLRTRCISRKDATRMLAHGFVDDLLDKIKDSRVHQKLNILMGPSFKALE